MFINTIISFIIVAFAMFLLIHAINTLQKKEKASSSVPSKPRNEELLLMEIRDLLKIR